MNSITLPRIAILAIFVFASAACDRVLTMARVSPTAEDVRIGRQAISLSEVSLLARSGYAKEALTAVKERHVPEQLSAEEELQFRGFAKGDLLAALKDSRYILTPPQKDAYDEAKGKQAIHKEQTMSRQSLAADNQIQQAYAASAAEQEEIQRRAQLSHATLRLADQRQAERDSLERELLRSSEARWGNIEAQNQRHDTYPRRYQGVYTPNKTAPTQQRRR
jgi:hypothetical protein